MLQSKINDTVEVTIDPDTKKIYVLKGITNNKNVTNYKVLAKFPVDTLNINGVLHVRFHAVADLCSTNGLDPKCFEYSDTEN